MLCRCRTCSADFHTAEHPPRCPTCLRRSTVEVIDADAPLPSPPPGAFREREAAPESTEASAAPEPRLRGPSVEPRRHVAPRPAWMLFGFAMVMVVVMVIAQGLPPNKSAWFNVGLALGLLICLAGAAWALERGIRGITIAPGPRRRIWVGLSVLLTAGVLGFAVVALYTDIAKIR